MVYMGMGGGVERSCVCIYTHMHINIYMYIYIYHTCIGVYTGLVRIFRVSGQKFHMDACW